MLVVDLIFMFAFGWISSNIAGEFRVLVHMWQLLSAVYLDCRL